MKRYFFIISIIFLVCFAPKARAASIGFDASSTSGQQNNVTTFTWSHTVTSSQANTILWVAMSNNAFSAITFTGVSYDGIALTKSVGVANASQNNDEELWYLLNPPTGTHNVSTTLSASASLAEGSAGSFYNVKQTSPIDATATSTANTAQNATTTLTTSVANDWTFEAGVFSGSTIISGDSNQIMLVSDGASNLNDGVSFSTTTAAGNYSTGFATNGAFSNIAMAMATFEPAIPLITQTSIGFDASSTSGEQNAATTITWSHTATSSQPNLLLLVNLVTEGSPPSALGVSYGGMPLSKALGFTANSSQDEEIWYLVNPPQGTHTVSTTLSASATHVEGNATTFYNVNQSTPIDAVATSTSSGVKTGTSTLTTTVANDWTFEGSLWGGTVNVSGNTNQTMIYSDNNSGFSNAVSFSTTTNPGSYSTGFQVGSSINYVMGMVALEPTPLTIASGYAWGNKLGWVNFGTELGNLQVLTTTVIGYAWSQNFGWINLAPAGSGVVNDGNGNLSGYAWAQNAGYINFSGVTIDQSGVFHGVASGSIAGSLVFDSSTGCVYCNVSSSWKAPTITPLTVTAVNLNTTIGGMNPASIVLTPDATTNINVNATITDNTCSQIAAGTTTILLYRSGVTSSTCESAPNNANCYIVTAFTASSTCSGNNINTTTTFPVQYYAQATDASSSFPNQNWMATVIFNDSSATTSSDSTSASSSNDMATLVALNIPTSSLNYGALAASSTTGSVNQLLNLENAGNASDTIAVNGTALTSGGNTIATSSQHYATSSFIFGGGEQQLSSAATTIAGINIAPVINFPIGGAGWKNTQALPYTDEFHTSLVYNGYLYTIGGSVDGSNTTITSTILFAPINATGSIGAWTKTQSMPYTDFIHTSVAYNGYLYTIGGEIDSGGATTSTVSFAPINATGSIGAWTKTQSLPYTDIYHTSLAYNGYLYTIGGFANGVAITSTVLFAPINATGSIGAWTKTQSLPYTDGAHTSVAYNGYLYTIGGSIDGVAITSTVLFAPINATGSLGAWTSTQSLPYTDYYDTSFAYNGYLYTIGGEIISGGATTSTVSFAPINATGSIGAWTSTQALPYTDGAHTSVAYNGYLYTIGGYANGATTSTVLFAPLNARSTYWGVSVPNGSAKGTYTGTNTITATFSP